eukprot:11848313-Alexandrium_andersonii.AAC.1
MLAVGSASAPSRGLSLAARGTVDPCLRCSPLGGATLARDRREGLRAGTCTPGDGGTLGVRGGARERDFS